MEQGATGINSSVPTASLTGRIQFFLLPLRTSTHRLLRCICFESVQPPLVSPRLRTGLRVVRWSGGPNGYEPRAPGALSCDFHSLHFVHCRPGWPREEEVQSPARPSEAWNPTPPARSLHCPCICCERRCCQSRIRASYKAPRVPRSRNACRRNARAPERAAPQQVPDKVPVRVRLAARVPHHGVLPRPG